MRCHYYNEFGHFVRECSKKNRDENKAGHFNGMSTDYYGDGTQGKTMMMMYLPLYTVKGVRAQQPHNSY